MTEKSPTIRQRDREFLAEFLESMCHSLMREGGVHRNSVLEVANALKLAVDGVWVKLAATEAEAADGWGSKERRVTRPSPDAGTKAAIARLLGRGDKPTRSDVDSIYLACEVAIPLPPGGPQLDVAKALAELLELRQQVQES